MVIIRELRRRARLIIGPVLGLALAGYFAYNTVEGDHGLVAWLHKTRDLHDAEAALGVVQAKRAALEKRVGDMRPDHIDPDLLDQQVRATLNFAAPDQIVIMRQSVPVAGAAPQ